MDAPVGTSPEAARAYRLLPDVWTRPDAQSGWLLLHLVVTLTAATRPVWLLAEDPGADEWLQPETCPVEWLPFVARCVGATLEGWQTEEQMRAEVRSPAARRRGHRDATRLAALAHMVPGGRLRIRRRFNPAAPTVDSPGHHQLLAHPDDVLPGHADALIRDVLLALPSGYIGHVEITASRTWQDAVDEHDTWDDAVTAHPTWQDLIDDTP
ncbi:MAG: hypothetical protein AB7G37_00985 [Solirubrobacteraceae bacterium]